MNSIYKYVTNNENLGDLAKQYAFHKIFYYIYETKEDVYTEREKEIIAMLMYSFYKKEKVEYIVKIKNATLDKDINEKLIDGFSNNFTEDKLEDLENQAINLMSDVVNVLLNEKSISLQKEEHKLYRNFNIKNFLFGMLQSMMSSLLFVLISALFILGTNINKIKELIHVVYK
ncbi:MAG: hypothetical protein ACTTKD_07645 [Peptoanaerobacter stomatis]|uniref:hypothetical protein n=1 Tax=Peptoanaerobacter stomatis TaxID=796937 RepID=UPI003FA00B5A